MNARRLAITAITLLGVPCSDAQNLASKAQAKPVLDIIRNFKERDSANSNDVTDVPDPAVEAPAPIQREAKPKPDEQPVAATGQTPEATEPVQDPENPSSQSPQAAPTATPSTPPQSLAVRVEKLQAGSGMIDPSQVKLLFPFPAKPLTQPPAGWCLKSSQTAPPITREVELSPGNKITLTIRPDLLVPDADGVTVFSVPEPGFNPSLGYRQNATVGTILSRSIRQLDAASMDLATAIDKLQQILVSLPKPEPVPAPQPAPIPEPKTKPLRKR